MTIEEKIGNKVRNLRNQNGLTQDELASRTELTKGFISQLERGQTAPSISTLADIVECLGSNMSDFFHEDNDVQIVFKEDDCFEKIDEDQNKITWLVNTAQNSNIEPILVNIQPGKTLVTDKPHEGEEFGYVLEGRIKLRYGQHEYTLEKGDSFLFPANKRHCIGSASDQVSTLIWISTPPNF